jgi:hypothetical protein
MERSAHLSNHRQIFFGCFRLLFGDVINAPAILVGVFAEELSGDRPCVDYRAVEYGVKIFMGHGGLRKQSEPKSRISNFPENNKT